MPGAAQSPVHVAGLESAWGPGTWAVPPLRAGQGSSFGPPAGPGTLAQSTHPLHIPLCPQQDLALWHAATLPYIFPWAPSRGWAPWHTAPIPWGPLVGPGTLAHSTHPLHIPFGSLAHSTHPLHIPLGPQQRMGTLAHSTHPLHIPSRTWHPGTQHPSPGGPSSARAGHGAGTAPGMPVSSTAQGWPGCSLLPVPQEMSQTARETPSRARLWAVPG